MKKWAFSLGVLIARGPGGFSGKECLHLLLAVLPATDVPGLGQDGFSNPCSNNLMIGVLQCTVQMLQLGHMSLPGKMGLPDIDLLSNALAAYGLLGPF